MKNQRLADVEADHIQKILDANNWQKSRVARILAITRTTLYRKISEYGLQRPPRATA